MVENIAKSAIRIRRALASDAGALHRMIKALAKYENLEDQVLSSEADILKYGFGENPHFSAIIAENEEGRAAGFAIYLYHFSSFVGRPVLFLEDLFVLEEFRRRGIAQALLKHLAEIALAENCTRMEWVVLDWNEPAIRFYKALKAAPKQDWQTFSLEKKEMRQLLED